MTYYSVGKSQASNCYDTCMRIWYPIYIACTIMEYGSTPYIGMAPKKMAAPLYVYKVICSVQNSALD